MGRSEPSRKKRSTNRRRKKKKRQGKRKLRGRLWKLERRRRSLKRQKPRDRRCWMPKRPALVPRSLLLGREPVMPTRRCPRPRSSWRKERGLARRLEMLPLLRERKRVVRKQLPRRK